MWWRYLSLSVASLLTSTTQAVPSFEHASDRVHVIPSLTNSDHHVLSRTEHNGNGIPAVSNLKLILERRQNSVNGRLKYRKSTSGPTFPNGFNKPDGEPIQQHPEGTKTIPIEKRDYSFSILSAAPPTQSDSLPIHQDGEDYSYFTPVTLGSGGKLVYLLVDTGATNAWVMGSDCKTEACGVHRTFGSEDSTTMKRTGAGFTIGYGTGVVSGELVNDTVVMGGLSLSTTFGVASNVSDEFTLLPADGILSLSRPSSGNFGYTTIIETLIQSRVLEANVIGINLQRASDGTADGELNFGSPDTTKYTGELVYVDTIPGNKDWEIPIDDIIIDGVPCNFTGERSYIDTGTSFMLFPTEDAQRIHSLIPGSRQVGDGFQIPCSSDALFEIKLCDTAFSVRPEDYVGNPIEGGDFCGSNIDGGLELGPNKWIFGDVFLKNVYTVLDFDKHRIGFGRKDPVVSSKADHKVALASSELISTMPSTASPTPSANSTAELSSASSSPLPQSPSPTSKSGGAQSTASATPTGDGSRNVIPHLTIFYAILAMSLPILFLS